MRRLLGTVVIEYEDDRTSGVDIRVYKWLSQWLDEDQSKELVYSLSVRRLTELVIAYQPAIEAMPVWGQ